VTDRAFSACGLDHQVSIEITNDATGAAYVQHGLGAALLPGFVVASSDTRPCKSVSSAARVAGRPSRLPTCGADGVAGS
jgi:DNA-binding transcriptional LysR family regulator